MAKKTTDTAPPVRTGYKRTATFSELWFILIPCGLMICISAFGFWLVQKGKQKHIQHIPIIRHVAVQPKKAVGFSAKPNHRWFYYTCSFSTTDHRNWNEQLVFQITGFGPVFDSLLSVAQRDLPQTIVVKTFKITELREVFYREYLRITYRLKHPKPEKKEKAPIQQSANWIAWDSQHYFTSDGSNMLNITSDDSLKNFTVEFNKSRVHFINDSTFTFQNK